MVADDGTTKKRGQGTAVMVGVMALALASLIVFGAGAVRAVLTPGPIWFEGPVVGFMDSIRAGRLYQATALQAPPYSILTHTPLTYFLDYGIYSHEADIRLLRLVNIVATLGCAALVGLIIRLQARARKLAGWLAISFGVGLFLSCTPVFFWSQVARSADAFACLFSMASLAVLLGARPSPVREAAVGTLLALAILSKQSELAVLTPVLFAYAIFWERRFAGVLRQIAFAIAVLLPVCVWLQWRTHGGFYSNVIDGNAVRMQFAWWAMINERLLDWWLFAAGAVLAGALRKSPITVWCLVAVAFGVVGTAKRGADTMYYFDASAALAILAGTSLARFREPARFVMAGLLLPGTVLMLRQDLSRMQSISDASSRDYARLMIWLKPHAGRQNILSDDAAIPVALGEMPVWDDPFVFSEWAARGRWSDATIVAAIQRQQYAVIVVTDPNLLWTPSLRRAITQNYRLAVVFPEVMPAPRCVYVPGKPGDSGTQESGVNSSLGSSRLGSSCAVDMR